MGLEGQTALIPKEEGQGVILCLFVNKDYEFNFDLSKEQFKVVNESRKGQYYKDVQAAELNRGNPEKKSLESSLFSKKFEYVNSKNRYWSYEDMLLQLEDCADVFKAINGEKYDYCFLFDHSNSYDRLRPDGLNLNKISIYFGGKQAAMRDSVIENKTCIETKEHIKTICA